MRRASQDARHAAEDATTVVAEQTTTFLRKLHPSKTADRVAADLKLWRVKSATIAKMLERQSTPGPHLLLAMMCAYGPEFLCAVVPSPPAWLVAAHRAERQQILEARIAAARAELEKLS